MYAFYKSKYGMIKVYCDGSDWQCFYVDSFGNQFERWFSVWQDDKLASLERAIYSIDDSFISDLLIICEA